MGVGYFEALERFEGLRVKWALVLGVPGSCRLKITVVSPTEGVRYGVVNHYFLSSLGFQMVGKNRSIEMSTDNGVPFARRGKCNTIGVCGVEHLRTV